MKEHILTTRIQRELRDIERCLSNKIINAVCFYGLPGSGKTTYAKSLGSRLAHETNYIDCALKPPTKIEVTDLANASLLPLFDDYKPFDRCIILDEFHNLSPKDQSCYKVQIEANRDRTLYIFCLNVSEKKLYAKSVEVAIRSRCEAVCFDLQKSEADEHAEKVHRHFPSLTVREIELLLPDMRQVARQAAMRSSS